MRYIDTIEQVHQELKETYAPFESDKGVLPFQCRRAMKQLANVKGELRNCYTFLKEAEAPPLVILALRYQFLDKLSYLSEQVDKVTSYMYEMNAGKYSTSFKTHIGELFADLFPLLEAIPQQASHMFEEAYFQEQRLANITQK